MADTISHVWQTVEQAAVTLNCSTRTIARRISGGTMESRVDENGRRLVLVQTVSDVIGDDGHAVHPEDVSAPTSIATAVQSASQSGAQSEGLMVNEKAAGMLAVLQSTIDAAREDAYVARTGARWAWAGIGLLALALASTTVILNQSATRAEVKATMLQQQVSDTKAELGQTRNDLLAVSAARAVAEQEKSIAIVREKDALTKLADAERDRQTAAVSAADAKKPTTQPVAPLKAFVNLFSPDGQ